MEGRQAGMEAQAQDCQHGSGASSSSHPEAQLPSLPPATHWSSLCAA